LKPVLRQQCVSATEATLIARVVFVICAWGWPVKVVITISEKGMVPHLWN
jgi:hypothetical protein